MSDESSDGAPARPRKKVRRVMLLSDADDDSDSSGGVVRRRKRLRVVSDADSESSGSDIVVRRRALRQLQDSDDDSSGWETDPSPNNTEAGMLKTSGFSSDSSEGNSDKCAICLLRFKQQEVGTPNNCQHYFCIDCITEWSKNVNTCPVDRSVFTSIVVRSSIGGKELRSVPVKVAERRLSEEILVIEDPTYCQICRHCDREEYMLLCDTCDMGYHMDCLSPPLEHIPLEEWHCPECAGEGAGEADGEEEVEYDEPLRAIITRATPRLTRYLRQHFATDASEPSTSSPTTSTLRPSTSTSRPTTSTSATTSRSATSRPRRPRRRRTRAVVVEYELADGTKRPVTRTVKVKRRKKKRKARRQPRTAARRKHVRESVQARLRSLRDTITREAVTTSRPVGELALSRHRAGIPSLSLFGDASQLEYFSDDEDVESGSAGGVAVVPRMSTSSILGSLRQSRRKAVVINSPQHASAAPDILSTILESQTLLHSKNSLVAVTVDGTVNIKIHKAESSKRNNNEIETPKDMKKDKIDISNAGDSSKKVPSYPGQSRGGNWNGGYRDNYNRNQGNNYNNNRNNYDYRGGGDFQGRGSFNNTNDWHNNRNQNFESDYRQNRPEYHDSDYERPLNNNSRFPNNRGRGSGRFNDLRRSSGPWQFSGSNQGPEPPLRHSFGGFDDAIDMRMSQDMHSNNSALYDDNNTRFGQDISQDNVNMYEDVGRQNNYSQENVNMYDERREENEENIDLYSDIENNRKAPTPPPFAPLPEPPVFRFPVETEKSEDEKSDSGLVIDTEKYDPTDPTHGDSSGDENKPSSSRTNKNLQYPFQRATEPNALSITSTVLDKAVELVLQEHRNLIANKSRQDSDESDGDCPNYSIYSATSVNIANNTSSVITETIKPSEGYEDLVQEDDEPYDANINLPPDAEKPPSPPGIPDFPASETKQEVSDSTDLIPLPTIPAVLPDLLKSQNTEPATPRRLLTAAAKKLSPMDYTEKVSKRCPITPSLRNPINFKLTPSSNLIKRNLVELNDDNDEEEEDLIVNTLQKEEKNENSSKIQNETKTSERVDKEEKVEREHSTESSVAIEMEDDTMVSPPESLKNVSNKNIDNSLKDPEISTEDVSQTSIHSEDEISRRSRSPSSEKQVPIEKQDTGSERDSVEDEKVDPTKEDKDNEGEKMTESISETEDERSYTPCLDENKSKDTSLETEKDKVGIEGLDTEMISEEEGNDIFSEIEDEQKSEQEISLAPKKDEEDGEIIEKKREKDISDRKKKKKEKRPEKDSKKKKTKSDIAFKKLSKSTKERNYRDKDDKKKNRDKRKSDDDEASERPKKKEKRKEIERYDVRMVVSEKRRKFKDEFGRDQRSKSPSIPLTPRRRSMSPEPRNRFSRSLSKRSVSLPRKSLEPRSRSSNSIPRLRRSRSPSKPMLRRLTPMRRLSRSISRGRRSISRRSMSRLRRSPVNRRSSPMLPRRRSMSPRGRKRNSNSRAKKSISPRRSISPKMRRDISPKGRHSNSPKHRKNITPRIRRSISPRGKRSITPLHRRAISPRIRRSISPKGRRSISPRRRKSISPRRHIVSPKRKKSLSPKARRSVSRGRKRRRSVLRSPKARKSKSPKKKKRSKSRHQSLSRKRSRSKPKKSKKSKLRKSRSPRRKSPRQKKKKNRSVSPEIVFSPERDMEIIPTEVWREPSPVYGAWSRASRSINSRLLSPSWTPPRDISPDHYRAMLEDEERARKKQKKRQREIDKMQRHKHCKDLVGPSKEVFTSGNNILVSVSFNKDNENIGIDDPSKKRKKKDKKKRRKTNKTVIDENVKPVAIIDLEKSPFREITPSPKNVIVLSDSDHADKEEERERQTPHAEIRETLPEPPAQAREPFQTGPKTPPEPSIKFSIMSKPNTQLRPLNPLHEPEENEGENQESEEVRHKETHKGPNTPPEPPNSPPSSPDAYDPFEPTKSRSQSPEAEKAKKLDDNDQSQEKQTITLETAQKTNLSADDVVNQRPITPIEKVMALLQSTRNVSPTQIPNEINREGENDRPATPDAHGDSQDSQDLSKTQSQSHFSSATVAPTVVATTAPLYLNSIPRIGAFTNAPSPRSNQSLQITSNQRIVLPSPTKSSPLKTQPSKLFLAKPSPIKSTPIKPMPKTLISKLPLPSVKPLPGRKTIDTADLDMDSPYSPGSSDFGDLFEPPSDATGKPYAKSGNGDVFDSLFGSKPISKNRTKNSSATKVPVKRIKKGNKTQVGVKVDEDNLKIMDELPSSAVEMQVKSKFLKKLNRQERVVEEVKLVLKPYYNKKYVTKEQYKEILRRTVPKICHNKTGEINPSKIQALVKAYVKKYRKKNKQGTASV